MSNDELIFSPAWELKELLLQRKVSSVELTELYLRRIEKVDSRLNSYLTVTADIALDQARTADDALSRGDILGPLHGIPVSIKDLSPTKGIRTTRGSLVYKDDIPEEDDITVERLRDSGAVFLGKTNTPEFGHRGTTENLLGDACRNPWNTERTTGGSSGGAAAALAADLCALATGSDGGGSIRIPAGFCGVYGIKPSQGRVPFNYTNPGGWRVFAQTGPMARNVRDATLLFQVLAGPDRRDPLAIPHDPPDFEKACIPDAKDLKIAWSPDLGFAPVDPEVKNIAQNAALKFSNLGATVEEVDLKLDGEKVLDIFRTVWISDYVVNYGHLLPKHRNDLDPVFTNYLEEAGTWSAAKLAAAIHDLEWHRDQMAKLFDKYDLLLTPTLAVPAFPIGQAPEVIDGRRVIDPIWGYTPFTYAINMSGQPAASIPCGFNSEGLPVGLHIIAKQGDETTIIRASAAFEESNPWQQYRPTI